MKNLKLICLLAALTFCAFPVTRWAADWPTFGHDPQRTGWASGEDALSVENVANLKLLWKTQIKNEARSLSALTAPVVAEQVGTKGGIRDVVYVAGSSDNISAVDAKTGELIWSRNFDIHVQPKGGGMWLCPNNLNATPTIDRERQLIYVVSADGKFQGLDWAPASRALARCSLCPPIPRIGA